MTPGDRSKASYRKIKKQPVGQLTGDAAYEEPAGSSHPKL